MVRTRFGGAPLLAGVIGALGLLLTQAAVPGILMTKQTLADFQFDGSQVEYALGERHLVIRPADDFSLAEKTGGAGDAAEVSGRGKGKEALYLDGQRTVADGVGGALDVVGSLVSPGDDSTRRLLDGAMKNMAADRSKGRFDFLVHGDTVSGDLLQEYVSSGIYVQIAGMDSGRQADIYRAIAQSQASSGPKGPAGGPEGGGAGPAISNPGTLFLLLSAGIPLLVSRLRR